MTDRRANQVALVCFILIIAAILMAMLTPQRQPHPPTYRCDNGATPVTWTSHDGDGQVTRYVRCG